MAVGWFQMILDLQGWIKKGGGIVPWESEMNFSWQPFFLLPPPTSSCFSHFFAHSSLVSLFSKNDALPPDQFYTFWTRSRENHTGEKEKRERSTPKVEEGKGGGRRGRKIPWEREFQCGWWSIFFGGWLSGKQRGWKCFDRFNFVPWIFDRAGGCRWCSRSERKES